MEEIASKSGGGASADDRKAKVWSQAEQKLLEQALSRVGKDAPNRWDRIAEMVPGKSKVSFLVWLSSIMLGALFFSKGEFFE